MLQTLSGLLDKVRQQMPGQAASLMGARLAADMDGALSFLADVSVDGLDAGAGATLTIELPGGMTFDMTGAHYARDWALPQFYFHVITAYAILRNQGAQIGKADYVPHMFAYLRPGSIAAR